MQYDGVRIPYAGDRLDQSIHSASWLQALVRAATGRSTNYVPQDPPEEGITLLSHGSGLLDGSLIGAIAPTSVPTPTYEPSPYLQATLSRSLLTLYVKQTYVAANTTFEAFTFKPGVPVRVRVDPTLAYYQIGMPVGRLPTYSTLCAGGGGLILLSLPYTPDTTNYYAWVMLDVDNLWSVRYKDYLYAAVQNERDPTTAEAYVNVLKTDGDYKTNLSLKKTVTNRFKHISIPNGTYGDITWKHGEWKPVTSDCPGSDSASGSI